MPYTIRAFMSGQDRQLYAFAFRIFGDFGVTIAIPAVAAALAGKWLDERYDTSPRYLVLLLILAFVFTAILIRRKAKQYGDEYQKLTEKL